MNDLESRLRDVLSERAAAAPDATGLAHGARRRLRRRRTTRAVVAVAVVAAAVPLGLSQVGSGGGARVIDRPVVATDPPAQVESDHRTESWHDITLEVPADWGYGGVTSWCLDGVTTPDAARPVVTRPDTMVATIMCTPGSGYGVTIGSSELVDPVYESGRVWQYDAEGTDVAVYPDGAWLGYWYDAGVIVTVVTPDRALTQRVVDSVRTIDGVDANECPVTLGEAEVSAVTDAPETFSICRYGPDDLLTASRLLIGTESQVAQDAIFSSPRRTADYDCPTEDDLTHTALLSSGGYVATAVTDASCPGWNGLFMSGVVRDLTPEAERHLDLSQLPVGE